MYCKCQKCGRKLTDPESIMRGFGPECWSAIAGHEGSERNLNDEIQIKGQISFCDFPDLWPLGETPNEKEDIKIDKDIAEV